MPSAFSKNEGMDEALAQNNDVSGPSPLESRSIPLCIQIDPDCGMAVNQQFSCIGQSNQMLWLHSTSWIRLFHCDTPLHDTRWKEDILGFSFSDQSQAQRSMGRFRASGVALATRGRCLSSLLRSIRIITLPT